MKEGPREDVTHGGLSVCRVPVDGGAMPNPRNMWCVTCDQDEPHRPLTKSEQQQLRDATGRKYTGDFFTCMRPGCGTLRTGSNKSPFDRPRKLP